MAGGRLPMDGPGKRTTIAARLLSLAGDLNLSAARQKFQAMVGSGPTMTSRCSMGLLTAADTLLRQGLEKKKLDDTDHIVLAIAPDGAPVICSNCGPAALRAMAAVLVAIADRVETSGGIKTH